MRHPRFRLRTLMIVVAVVAVALSSGRVTRHWRICQSLADSYASSEKVCVDGLDATPGLPGGVILVSRETWAREEAFLDARLRETPAERRARRLLHLAYATRAKRIYERAAWQPWSRIPTPPAYPGDGNPVW